MCVQRSFSCVSLHSMLHSIYCNIHSALQLWCGDSGCVKFTAVARRHRHGHRHSSIDVTARTPRSTPAAPALRHGRRRRRRRQRNVWRTGRGVTQPYRHSGRPVSAAHWGHCGPCQVVDPLWTLPESAFVLWCYNIETCGSVVPAPHVIHSVPCRGQSGSCLARTLAVLDPLWTLPWSAFVLRCYNIETCGSVGPACSTRDPLCIWPRSVCILFG